MVTADEIARALINNGFAQEVVRLLGEDEWNRQLEEVLKKPALSISEIAKFRLWGTECKNTVRNRIREYCIPNYKDNRKILIPIEEVKKHRK